MGNLLLIIPLIGLTLTWEHPAPETVDHYCIKFSEKSGEYAPQCQKVTGMTYPLDAPATPTYAVVTAKNSLGDESGPSNEVLICPTCPPDLSAEVTKLKADLAAMTQDRNKWKNQWRTCDINQRFWQEQEIACEGKLRTCEGR
jgi:hypothetical protein